MTIENPFVVTFSDITTEHLGILCNTILCDTSWRALHLDKVLISNQYNCLPKHIKSCTPYLLFLAIYFWYLISYKRYSFAMYQPYSEVKPVSFTEFSATHTAKPHQAPICQGIVHSGVMPIFISYLVTIFYRNTTFLIFPHLAAICHI